MALASSNPSIEDRIVDATLELASERGWSDLHLHHVATLLDLPLSQIRHHFQDIDAVANAWFARAQGSMLELPKADLAGATPPDRLHQAIMCWFDALSSHRDVTGQMLQAKLYLSHPHHWVPMIFDLSRLIHWFLDAARIESTGRQRQVAEIGLTLIFLTTLRDWLRDQSDAQSRTRARLRRRLIRADRWLGRCC